MAISVFKRYERKYMLDPEKYRKTIDFLSDYMVFDKYCVGEQVYGLLNVYFDTPDNLLIGRSTDKPIYKEKLRLRSYFLPENEDSKVFFEIKKILILFLAFISYIECNSMQYITIWNI